MAQRSPGRPHLYEQARQLRIRKGITQREAADLLGKSQAFVSLLETDGRSLDEERDYLQQLKKAPTKRDRTAGGDLKVGRLRKRASHFLRGEPLLPDFDYESTLPADGSWAIVSLVRSSPDTEFAILFDGERLIEGFVGFHLIGNTIKRGRIIAITEEYASNVHLTLDAFVNHDSDLEDLDEEEDNEDADGDNGLLADDAPEVTRA